MGCSEEQGVKKILTGWKNILGRTGRVLYMTHLGWPDPVPILPSSCLIKNPQVTLPKAVWTDDQGISLLLCSFHKNHKNRVWFKIRI